jgi:hypothetical protein
MVSKNVAHIESIEGGAVHMIAIASMGRSFGKEPEGWRFAKYTSAITSKPASGGPPGLASFTLLTALLASPF